MIKRTTIQKRITLLFSLLTLIFLLTLFMHRHIEQDRLKFLAQEEQRTKEAVFDKILSLKGEAIKTIAYDYTIWDEMVDFANGASGIEWAVQNLDTSLDTYKIQASWVYNPSVTLVYGASKLNNEGMKILPLAPETIKTLLDSKNFCYFFIHMPQGIVEVRGSIIHGSADIERVEPHGYFFAGRLWDQAYLKELSELANASVTLHSLEENIRSTQLPLGQIEFIRDLPGWNGAAAARLKISFVTEHIRRSAQITNQVTILLVAFSLLSLALIGFGFWQWVQKPLHRISQALEKGDSAPIGPLMKEKTEMGDVAVLIKKFFEQQRILQAEIDERRHAEEGLAISEKKYRNLFESTREGLAFINNEGYFLQGNPALLTMTGYTLREIRGMKFKHLTPDSRHWLLQKFNEEIEQRGYTDEYELECIRKSGTLVPVTLKMWAHLNPDGKILGAWAIIRDNSEQRVLQEHLIDAEKAKIVAQIAAGVAHEVKNPLAIIMQGLEYFVRQVNYGEDKIVPALITDMRDAVLRADGIIRGLIDLTKPGQISLKPDNINSVIENAILLLRNNLNRSNIMVAEDLCPSIPRIALDRDRMTQVIINIFNNAIEAMPAGGTLAVRSLEKIAGSDRKVVVIMDDTGPGIPVDVLNHIFDPFFTTKRHRGGAGLGLSVVRNIILMHNGTIEIFNREEGGSRVQLTFPVIAKI